MRDFTSYANHVRKVAQAYRTTRSDRFLPAIENILGDEPLNEVRRLVDRDNRRAHGAFFTGRELAGLAASNQWFGDPTATTVLDPTCGVGDLLLAVARRLPMKSSYYATAKLWRSTIAGFDIQPHYLTVARARLELLILKEGLPLGSSHRLGASMLRKADAHQTSWNISKNTKILMNPPFGLATIPHRYDWACGKVSEAAVFVCDAILRARSDTEIIAILPESLRSGTRYRRWREWVSARAQVRRIQPLGQFDQHTDIHAFIVSLRVQDGLEPASSWTMPPPERRPSLGDIFDVRVGPVVEYRDSDRGPLLPYVRPTTATAWKTIHESKLPKRRYSGRSFTPPFIVLRRTSRPGDKYRLVPSLIIGSQAVAVENHLIVLLPKDGKRETCTSTIQALLDPEVSGWVDKRIRCRHLTISAVAETPISTGSDGV